MKRTLLSTLMAGAVLALPTTALADCASDLGALKASYDSGSKDAILQAAETFRTTSSCSEPTVVRAMSDASGILARMAQQLFAAGDIDGAEEMLKGAPGLHWAVQVTRAEIAVKRGDRLAAAKLYNAALDTITDPAITKPNPALVPIADRITRLGQENLMLAGSLEPIVTRSGGASGVLKSAMRGIAIEAYGTKPPVEDDYVEDVKKDDDYVEEKNDDVYVDDDGYADIVYVEPEPVYEDSEKDNDIAYVQPVEPEPDYYVKAEVKTEVKVEVYAENKPKEDYIVADKAAEAAKIVYLPIQFGFDSFELDPSGVKAADTVADFLIKSGIKSLTLVGHTDEKGSDAYNLTLSVKRAASVRRHLQAKGVYAQIYVEGVGERHPPKYTDINAYSDEERRAIARRVELVLHQ